jgi:hypothetical protein
MSKIISHLQIMVASPDALKEAPPDVVEKWVEGFKRNASRINERRKARVPHGEAFGARVAGVSSKVYRQVINPNFVSRAGLSAQDIINRQAVNLSQSFKKYHEGLEAAFRTEDGIEAKRFKEQVEAARQHYSEGTARKTIPFTGIPGSRGPIAIAVLWLTADPIVEGELTGASEILEGGPLMITRPESRPAFKAALAPRLQQAGAAIVDAGYNQLVMQQHNDTTNSIVQGFADESLNLVKFTTGGDSHVDYIFPEGSGAMYLDIQVSRK